MYFTVTNLEIKIDNILYKFIFKIKINGLEMQNIHLYEGSSTTY
jgi:hypothetical protein